MSRACVMRDVDELEAELALVVDLDRRWADLRLWMQGLDYSDAAGMAAVLEEDPNGFREVAALMAGSPRLARRIVELARLAWDELSVNRRAMP